MWPPSHMLTCILILIRNGKNSCMSISCMKMTGILLCLTMNDLMTKSSMNNTHLHHCFSQCLMSKVPSVIILRHTFLNLLSHMGEPMPVEDEDNLSIYIRRPHNLKCHTYKLTFFLDIFCQFSGPFYISFYSNY